MEHDGLLDVHFPGASVEITELPDDAHELSSLAPESGHCHIRYAGLLFDSQGPMTGESDNRDVVVMEGPGI